MPAVHRSLELVTIGFVQIETLDCGSLLQLEMGPRKFVGLMTTHIHLTLDKSCKP